MNRFTKQSAIIELVQAPIQGVRWTAENTPALSQAVGGFVGSTAGQLQRIHSSDPMPEYSRAGRAIRLIEEAEQFKADARVLLTRAKMELAKRKARELSAYRSLRTGMI